MAAVRAARAEGQGLREVARSCGVSPETIRTWEAADLARAGGSAGAEARPPRRRATVATEDTASAAALLAAPLPSPDDPEALTSVRSRAALIGGLLERLEGAVETGEYPATSYVTLARYGDELARLLAELTPPAPKDPSQDQSVLECERVLLARIEGMVAEAERGGRR